MKTLKKVPLCNWLVILILTILIVIPRIQKKFQKGNSIELERTYTLLLCSASIAILLFLNQHKENKKQLSEEELYKPGTGVTSVIELAGWRSDDRTAIPDNLKTHLFNENIDVKYLRILQPSKWVPVPKELFSGHWECTVEYWI